jgi:hypothetical protein
LTASFRLFRKGVRQLGYGNEDSAAHEEVQRYQARGVRYPKGIVYRLYRLTEDEIAVVEASTKGD